ncbi:MAG: diguanylate cyclase [Alphaproteobacteria bacterium]|nr:diguanylate cyclase [Alphaproteobacteria bacterium]
MQKLKAVKVPKKFEVVFEKAEKIVLKFFEKKELKVSQGKIEISGERYLFIRAASLSYDFFECILNLYKGKNKKVAQNFTRKLLFDMAHAIGMKDAEHFHEEWKLKTPLEKISAGPPYFAYTGWAFVELLDDSTPTSDINFYLSYEHPHSFEADAWLEMGKKSDVPVCFMNAGYSSGWCEQSFGIPLISTEITCRAKGDKECTFIMAHPSKMKEYIARFLKKNPEVVEYATNYEIPDFFRLKETELTLRDVNTRLFESNKQLKIQRKALEAKARSISLLNEMGEGFTSAHSSDEIYIICIKCIQKMFPNFKGVIWTYSKIKNILEATAQWSNEVPLEKLCVSAEVSLAFQKKTIQISSCSGSKKENYICLPILLRDEIYGVLSITFDSPTLSTAEQDLLAQITRNLALALTNLKLRDSLYEMSIRDYLTGLYNRRYMEEMLSKALANAKRKESNLGVIMLDIDYFKNFNDTYGHEMGDLILKKIGESLKEEFREGDILCRFGGEEFLIILIDSSEKTTLKRAESLREDVQNLHIPIGSQELKQLTISLGVATFPENGVTEKDLFHAVDKALYQAKEKGRNRVCVAQV